MLNGIHAALNRYAFFHSLNNTIALRLKLNVKKCAFQLKLISIPLECSDFEHRKKKKTFIDYIVGQGFIFRLKQVHKISCNCFLTTQFRLEYYFVFKL